MAATEKKKMVTTGIRTQTSHVPNLIYFEAGIDSLGCSDGQLTVRQVHLSSDLPTARRAGSGLRYYKSVMWGYCGGTTRRLR